MNTQHHSISQKAKKWQIPPLRVATWNLNNFGLDQYALQDKANQFADAIVNDLFTPHIIAVQEMCDDSGALDNGVTTASKNAQAIIDAIRNAHGPEYKYIDVPPENNKDGGAPGANIRCGFFYRPDRVVLPSVAYGQHRDSKTARFQVPFGTPILLENPALIGKNYSAFNNSRKPIIAKFLDKETQETFFVANLHLSSNGYAPSPPLEIATSEEGRWKPDAKRLSARNQQAEIVADFMTKLRKATKTLNSTHFIVCGDFNTANRVVRKGVELPPVDVSVLKSMEAAELSDAASERLPNSFSVGTHNDGMTIDYLFVSPQLLERIKDAERPGYTHASNPISDHNPTIITIAGPRLVQAKPRNLDR